MRSWLAVAFALTIVGAQAARADVPQNPQIEIAYRQPTDHKFDPIYERLKSRHVLEELGQFLAPLRLPKKLTIQTDECGAQQRSFQDGKVTVCYELVDQIIKVASQLKPESRASVIAGAFIQATLHAVAYGVIEQLELPVWGRESDAADRLAALVMLKFGEEVAERTIKATALFFNLSRKTWTGSAFAAIDSPEDQRFYNYLCIAYGGSPITFGFVAQKTDNQPPILPQHRARQCGYEYEQIRKAFDLRIMPFVDPNLLVEIRATKTWLLPTDVK
jgi:hypothetical protein